MIGRGIFATTVLFALTIGVFATGAQAEQRAWTCAPEAGEYSDAHCRNNESGGFKAVEIASGTATETTITNEKTASETTASAVAKLRGKVGGVEAEIQCTTVAGSGSLTNTATAMNGTGTFELGGCTVILPAGRNCVVKGGAITSALVKGTTAGQAGFKVKFEPNTGTEFARIRIEGCLNNKPPTAEYPVAGSLVDAVSGATTTITHAESTAQGTLTFGGNPAGIEGAITGRMKGGNPIFLK